MLQKNYYVAKKTGFYQDVLTFYGLARLIDLIINHDRQEKVEITLKDCLLHYELETNNYLIGESDIDRFCTDPIIGFEYVFQQSKNGTKMPKHPDTGEMLNFNYIDIQREWEKIKDKDLRTNSQTTQGVHPDFSIYALFSHFAIEFSANENKAGTTQGGMFTRTFLQLYLNRDRFKLFILSILERFSAPNEFGDERMNLKAFPKQLEKQYHTIGANHKVRNTSYNQLINPTASKGINHNKPRLIELSGESSLLIEYLRILGCFETMFSIGGSADLEDYRVYVCEPKFIYLSMQRLINKSFSKSFYAKNSIKGDILASLLYSIEIINHSEKFHIPSFSFETNFSPKNFVNGFFVCHYMTIKKSPPKKHAPINLAYIGLPSFIEAETHLDAQQWLSTINELVVITRSIKGSSKNEESGVTNGLNKLRNFISTSEVKFFLDFQFWYSSYVMFAFKAKEKDPKWFVKLFRTGTLNKILKNKTMDDFKISDIISNEGFKKVAYAIRKSTVTLQYTPKDKRKYEIRYGLAQILQNKSKTSSDLAEFIGSFIATYNAETARFVEHIKNKETQIEETKVYPRANVKEKELTLFYELLDKYPSNVIGALLASYGFALTDKEASKQEEDQDGLEVEIQNDEEKRY